MGEIVIAAVEAGVGKEVEEEEEKAEKVSFNNLHRFRCLTVEFSTSSLIVARQMRHL